LLLLEPIFGCSFSVLRLKPSKLESPKMAYTFTPWEQEPEAQASSGRTGGPPHKSTGIGVLDSPVPPKKPLGPIPGIPASLLLRIVAGMLLVAVVAALALLLFRH
jgi:hypothetical protein